jgi:general secretion pathway protein E
VPFLSLARHVIQPETLNLVSKETAENHHIIPVDLLGDTLLLAMADPRDVRAIRKTCHESGMRVMPAMAMSQEINLAINRYYRASIEMEREIRRMVSAGAGAEGRSANTRIDVAQDTPVVRSVNLLMEQAVRDRASDIHIEPQPDRVRIRYRIDGVLHNLMSLPAGSHEGIISRLKVMAGMNIAERRRPQDGQVSMHVNGRSVDVRAATCHTAHGETMVLRILDKSESLSALELLGFSDASLGRYRSLLRSPFGMVLVGGPTGSGKTTTLYASVVDLNDDELNIVTIEDPIEYLFDGIKQIPVNAKAGITFAGGLRAIMRLDPDVIMVGEIRDPETAKMAVQAALTGHLVLASIHANDTVGTLLRLVDLGVEPYMVASAVIGTVSQRMTRRICPHCLHEYQPSSAEIAAYEAEVGGDPITYRKGVGCVLCANTGFLGRTGVFELFTVDERLRTMLANGSHSAEMRNHALDLGMNSLKTEGMQKVREGITTPLEVMRNVHSVS